MNLSFRIARRYLFARRSTNAINIITGIATFGVAVGAMALVLVLSVFNGFEELFLTLFNNLNADARIESVSGKTFEPSLETLNKLESIPGVLVLSRTVDEIAFLQYRDNQIPGRIKGVDSNYVLLNRLDTMILDGRYELKRNGRNRSIIGRQLRMGLGIDVTDEFQPLTIYTARRNQGGPLTNPLVSRPTYPSGVILTQQAVDQQYVIIGIELAQELLDLPAAAVSALEIKLAPGFLTDPAVFRFIEEVMGPDFRVTDRFEQEKTLLRLMRIEKWIGFTIVGFMMILISFNIVGALWMIVLDKEKDISILKSMGMTDARVRGIFFRVGLLLCLVGLLIGFVLAITVALLQQNFQLLDAYLMELKWYDFPVVAAVVLTIGLLASWLPARRAAGIKGVVREE
ncbi:MAG: FtsX-like permease family protein [Saprospiraceae bacterium]